MQKVFTKVTAIIFFISSLISVTACHAQRLERLGIASSKDVERIIEQSGFWVSGALSPMWDLHIVSDPAVIQAYYDALNHPRESSYDGPKMRCDSRFAFITHDGRIVMFPMFGGSGTCESDGVDLSNVYDLKDRGGDVKLDTTTLPCGEILDIEYHVKVGDIVKRLTRGLIDKHVQDKCHQLIGLYNPLSLKGNIEYSPRDMQDSLGNYSGKYLKIALKKPIVFNVVVVSHDLEYDWPPRFGDNRGRYKEVSYDIIYIAELDGNFYDCVRFGFASSKSKDTMLTTGVYCRPLSCRYAKRGTIDGENLFEELSKYCAKYGIMTRPPIADHRKAVRHE